MGHGYTLLAQSAPFNTGHLSYCGKEGIGSATQTRCMLSGCVASGTGLCITSCSVFRTVRLLLKYPVLFGSLLKHERTYIATYMRIVHRNE